VCHQPVCHQTCLPSNLSAINLSVIKPVCHQPVCHQPVCHQPVCHQRLASTCLPSRWVSSRQGLKVARRRLEAAAGSRDSEKVWKQQGVLEAAGKSRMEAVDHAINTVCHEGVCHQGVRYEGGCHRGRQGGASSMQAVRSGFASCSAGRFALCLAGRSEGSLVVVTRGPKTYHINVSSPFHLDPRYRTLSSTVSGRHTLVLHH